MNARDPHERRGLVPIVVLRVLAMLLLVAGLADPVWQRLVRVPTPPHLTILLDSSASMALPAGPGRTRVQQADAALRSAPMRDALRRFDAAIVTFADGLTDQPGGTATDAALALRQLSARGARGPVLVVSDGAETAGDARTAAAELRACGQPVYTVGLGPTRPPANVGPVVIQAPRVVREKQPVPVRALISATDVSGPQPVAVELDGKPVANLAAALNSGATAPVQCQLPGLGVGFHLLTIKTAPRRDEAIVADNTRSQIIEARRDATRLLLLAGAPDPDYAALRRLLARLPKLQAQAYVRIGPGRFLRQQGESMARQTPDLPRLLRDAHVVLLMNMPVSAGEAGTLRSFVQSGGALGWLGGKQATGAAALSPILPASPGAGYVPALTGAAPPQAGSELGQELLRAAPAASWRGVPFLEGVTPLGGARPGAEAVMLSGHGQPLLVTGSSGTGATLVFAGAGTYRWLLSAEADDESRRLYDIFWQSVIGWLSQPREQRRLVVMLDPAIAPAGQPVRFLAACGPGAQITAEVSGGGQKLTLPLSPSVSDPGRYAASLSNLSPGKYGVRFLARVGGAQLVETRQLVIEPGGIELAEPLQHVGKLQAIAAAGGGQYAPIEQLAPLLAQIPATAGTETLNRLAHPFRAGAALGLVALLLCVEWGLRRRWGVS